MSAIDTYLAVFLGSKTSARRKAWDALSDEQRSAKQKEGIAVWRAWVEKHRDEIVYDGGPLGKTKRVSGDGVADIANELAAFVIVRAESHAAAAKMFEGHPHFTIFPGEGVEVMPVMPIPGSN
jgi:hypothetical protein